MFYNTLKDSIFKEINKMNNISDYHNLIDIEEKSCSKTKSALNGLSKLSD